MRRIARLGVVAAVVMAGRPLLADECRCLGVPVFAKATGACSKTDTPTACSIVFSGDVGCDCRLRNGKARAAGSCSRTETSANCSLIYSDQSGVTPAESFIPKMFEYGISRRPQAVLSEVNTVPPEKWLDLRESILVLAASSMFDLGFDVRQIAPDLTQPGVLRAFTDASLKRGSADLSVTGTHTFASYGCVEVHKPEVSVMVKTRWSAAGRSCREFVREGSSPR